MLVIGYCGNLQGGDVIVSATLDVDPKVDSPRKIHNLLSDLKSMTFEHVVVVDNDMVVGTFSDGEDYDLREESEEDDEPFVDMFEGDPGSNDDFDYEGDEEFEDEGEQ